MVAEVKKAVWRIFYLDERGIERNRVVLADGIIEAIAAIDYIESPSKVEFFDPIIREWVVVSIEWILLGREAIA